MFESVKALIVVFVVCVGAFVFARIAFGEFVSVKIMDRWRNVFLLSTVAAFLIPNFWVFLLVFGAIAALAAGREDVKPAIYLLLLFAVPAAGERVPGFAGIRNFLNLAPYNILAIAVLFPLLFAGGKTREKTRTGMLADSCFIAFSVLSLALAFRDTTNYLGIGLGTPGRWFLRWFDGNRRRALTTLVPAAEAEGLVKGFKVEEAPQSFGVSRVHIDDPAQLWALEALIVRSLEICRRGEQLAIAGSGA